MDLIDRNAFAKRALPLCTHPESLKKMLDEEPTVDAEIVRHGHWITVTRHEHYPSGKEYEADYCSECHGRGSCEYDSCPHCRAKMDGGGNAGDKP